VWITTAVYTGNIAGSILITEQIEEEKNIKKTIQDQAKASVP